MMKIKYFYPFVLALCFMVFSASSQNTAQFDKEINRLTGKVQQYPGRTKNLDALKENYEQAGKIDQDRIKALIITGQPDIWYEIYQTYSKMENRQEMVMKLPEKAVLQMGIVKTDYQKNIIESKNRASSYLYAFSERLLQSEKPEDARQAYADLLKVARMNTSYKDLDKLIRKAILKGATNVKFDMYNRTKKVISSPVIEQLTIIIWEFKKARYGQPKPAQEDNSFAFTLRVVLDELRIGPDQIKDQEYEEQRDILQDGQVVDTISCLIQESRQRKIAQLSGSLEYYDNQIGQVVNHVPIKVESVFSNAYATLQGDPNAAGDETRELLKSKKAAYPSDEQMILDATEEFTKKAREIILAE
jgi:hypothetical protein